MPTNTRDIGLALPSSSIGCINRIERKILQAFSRRKEFDTTRALLFLEIAHGSRELRYDWALGCAGSVHAAISRW